jgi:JmjC domain
VFSKAFDRTPIGASHRLTDHSLLTIEAVASLAERLPEASIEQNLGDLPTVIDPSAVQRSDSSPGEIARGIETNGCWMVLKNIERDDDYNTLLNELLNGVSPLVADRDGGMTGREGFIFLSAPNSVTPSHTDPEHNFLLQVRGTKEITVGSFPDSATKELELEQTFGAGGHRNIDWEPKDPQAFHLGPGDGVYVPPHAPHWVKNGPAASVSLSITFQTPSNERAIRVYALNARLRRMGLSPTPPGSRLGLDRRKAVCQRVVNRLRVRSH